MEEMEESLAVVVKNYPVLFDKRHEDFHRKDVKSNAWNAVAKDLSLENGDEAEKAFVKLRDRYVRAKRELKAKDRSGSSAKALRKVRQKLEELKFLQWLDEYIKPRKSKGNCSDEDDQADGDYYNDGGDSLFGDSMSGENELVNEVDETPKQQLKKIETKKNQTKHTSKRKIAADVENEELKILRPVAGAVTSNHDQNDKKDDHDCFGEVVARKMRKLSSKCSEESLQDLEFEILSAIERVRKENSNQHQNYHVNPRMYGYPQGPFMRELNES